MKTYLVTYSLKFTNDEEIEADSPAEAIAKLRAMEEEDGELDALGGEEDGYQIEAVEEL